MKPLQRKKTGRKVSVFLDVKWVGTGQTVVAVYVPLCCVNTPRASTSLVKGGYFTTILNDLHRKTECPLRKRPGAYSKCTF